MKKNTITAVFVLLSLIFCGCVSSSDSYDSVSDESGRRSVSTDQDGSKFEEKRERGSGIRITVPSPTFQDSTNENNWMPQLIQDLLTSYFAEYSDMTVIDRANEKVILNEQRHSEDVIFSDEDAIELGNITNAQYVVASNIINAGGKYNITFRVLNTSTNEIKASYNRIFNIQEIQDGIATKLATREILPKLGIELSKDEIAFLTNESSNATEQVKIMSTVNLAKGMAAESKNRNLVEALSYYAESGNAEAEYRFQTLSTSISTGNIREDAKNDIALRKAWLKNYDDLQDYLNKNLITITYDVRPGEQKINYTTETVSIPFVYDWEINDTAFTVYSKLEEGLNATGKKSDWSVSSRNGSERTNFDIKKPVYSVNFVLKNDYGTVIGRQKVSIETRYDFNNYERDRNNRLKKEADAKALMNRADELFVLIPNLYSSSNDSNNKSTVKFIDIKIDDITDNLNFGIESIAVNEERLYNRTTREYEYVAQTHNPPLKVNVIGVERKNLGNSGKKIPVENPVAYAPSKYNLLKRGPAGGYVFWANQKGVAINGKSYHYMEVCPYLYPKTGNSNDNVIFSNRIEKGELGSISAIDGVRVNQSLGYGWMATNELIELAKNEGKSRSMAPVSDCDFGGYTDWFIPNDEEQKELSKFLYHKVFPRSKLKYVFTFRGAISYDGDSWDSSISQYPVPLFGVGSYDGFFDYDKYQCFLLIRYF